MIKNGLLGIVLLLAACSGGSKVEQVRSLPAQSATETPAASPDAQPVEEKEAATNPEKSPENSHEASSPFYPDSATSLIIQKLDSTYKRTPYFFKALGKTFFYICDGNWEAPQEGTFSKAVSGMGIVDEHGISILEPKYDKIYNPDATAKGFIEIEINNKKGLLNYQTWQTIPCAYDMIFPASGSEIAIGRIGNTYYRILPDGQQEEIFSDDQIPSYRKAAEHWTFINRKGESGNAKMLIDSYMPFRPNGYNEGNGVVFTPSYLLPLNFLPEVHTLLVIDQKADIGVVSSAARMEKKKSLTEKLFALISSFSEEGIDGRGYQITSYHLSTLDEKNNILDKEAFLQTSEGYRYHYCAGGLSDFRFLHDSLLEVKSMENTQHTYGRYDQMLTYHYYALSKEGKIQKLNPARFYDFTKYVLLTAESFTGCFSKQLEFDYSKWDEVEEGEGNLLVLDHLDVEDLDIMRNEIFAENGYIFKSEKWQQYFAGKAWYRARHENIDKLLTETEKANISLILETKEKILQDSTILHKRKILYAEAG